MRRMFTPLLMILTALALALPVGSTRAAERGVTFSALLPDAENWADYGTTQGGNYGQSVASAGDVNGDGYADIIVGSPIHDTDIDNAGAAFVYHGSSGGVSVLNATLISGNKGSFFGYAVSSAGDVNGDGYDDVVVGAPFYKVEGETGPFGAAFVYHGSSGGLSTTPAWSRIGPGSSELGCSAAGVGDVNNDGYDDVLVGACNYKASIGGEGAVFLFLGSAAGLSTASEPFADWQYMGTQASALLGFSVAGVGDLDHDGYADFAASMPAYDIDFEHYDAGLVHVWYGAASGPDQDPAWTVYGNQSEERFGCSVSAAGDIDGNHYIDILIGAKGFNSGSGKVGGAYLFTNTGGVLGSTPSWFDSGPDLYSGFGASVAGLGDLNNDGYADVGVGAPLCDDIDHENQEGCVFVYRGSNSGLSTIETWLGRGGKAETEFGMSVSGAGDVNGDGFDDLIVGAPVYKRDGKTPLGKAAVYHGAFAEEPPYYWFYLPVVTK